MDELRELLYRLKDKLEYTRKLTAEYDYAMDYASHCTMQGLAEGIEFAIEEIEEALRSKEQGSRAKGQGKRKDREIVRSKGKGADKGESKVKSKKGRRTKTKVTGKIKEKGRIGVGRRRGR